MRELIKRPELAINQKDGISHDLDCSVCKVNKCRKSRWRYSLRHATFPLQMVYINLNMRPVDERDARNGAPIVVVDDYTRYSWVLEPKGRRLQDVREALQQWLNTVERQSNSRVKCIGIRTAQVNKLGIVQDWLSAIGIQIEWLDSTLSTDDADIAGRHTRRLTEIATVLFHDSGLPLDFHYEIFAAAAYLRNRVGFVHKTDKTPFELWFGRKPTFDHVRTFGCKVHYFVNPDDRPRTAVMAAREGILLGHDTFEAHYWVLSKEDELIVTQDLRFTENQRGGLAEFPIHDVFDIVRPARLAHFYQAPLTESILSGSVCSASASGAESEVMSVGSIRSNETYHSQRSSSSTGGSVRSSINRLARSFGTRTHSDVRSEVSAASGPQSSVSGSSRYISQPALPAAEHLHPGIVSGSASYRRKGRVCSGGEHYQRPSRSESRRASRRSTPDNGAPGPSVVRGVSLGRSSRLSRVSGSSRGSV